MISNQVTSTIIFLDYENAFDPVEWPWTLKCLRKFNFVEKFVSWINMIFKDAKPSILKMDFVAHILK